MTTATDDDYIEMIVAGSALKRPGVAKANDVDYGLAADVFSPDAASGIAVAKRLRAGTVTINGGGAFRPDAPFGGFKASGIGREYGEWGVREFLEPQHVQWALR